jgi:catechol 2,3-dioxygenase
MGTLPLDLDSLLRQLDDPATAPFDGLAPGTTMGHVHLRVADVDATVTFYRDALGFGLMTQLGPQAAFLSAGGYHHHIGANIWESRNASPAPAGYATLQHATILVPDADERDRVLARVAASGTPADDGTVRDPSGNTLRLQVVRGSAAS